jgi:hypothetical protein
VTVSSADKKNYYEIIMKFVRIIKTIINALITAAMPTIAGIIIGALFGLVGVFGCQYACQKLVLFYTEVLGLTHQNGQIVLTWMLLLVIIDAILYRYLAYNKSLSIRCKPQPEWVINHCFVLQLLCRVAICILSLVPFVWEANTDSSLTMFMQNFSSTLAFQVYVGFLAASFSTGAILLWVNRKQGLQFKMSYFVPLQALSLILSDIPMFLGACAGFPVGLIANASINMLVVGLSVAAYAMYQPLLDRFLACVDNAFSGFKVVSKHDTQNPDAVKLSLYANVFAFLALSRLVSWWLACLYGPIPWLATIDDVYGACTVLLLLVLWLYSALRLWGTACSLKHTGFICVPLEPALVYFATVHDFVRVFYVSTMLRKRSMYRSNLKMFRFRRDMGMFYRVIKFFCRRWVFWVALAWVSLPKSAKTSVLSVAAQHKYHQSLNVVQGQVVLYSPLEQFAKSVLPALGMAGSVGIFGFYGCRYIGQLTEAQRMTVVREGYLDQLSAIDSEKLSSGGKVLYDQAKDTMTQSSGFEMQIKRGSLLDVVSNQESLNTHRRSLGHLDHSVAGLGQKASPLQENQDLRVVDMVRDLISQS